MSNFDQNSGFSYGGGDFDSNKDLVVRENVRRMLVSLGGVFQTLLATSHRIQNWPSSYYESENRVSAELAKYKDDTHKMLRELQCTKSVHENSSSHAIEKFPQLINAHKQLAWARKLIRTILLPQTEKLEEGLKIENPEILVRRFLVSSEFFWEELSDDVFLSQATQECALFNDISNRLRLFNTELDERCGQAKIDWLQESIERGEVNEYTYLELGIALVEEGNFLDSIDALIEVVRLNPENSTAVHFLAKAYFELEKFSLVRQIIVDASAIIRTPSTYTMLGLACEELGKYDEAKEAFLEAIKRDALGTELHADRGLSRIVAYEELFNPSTDDKMSLEHKYYLGFDEIDSIPEGSQFLVILYKRNAEIVVLLTTDERSQNQSISNVAFDIISEVIERHDLSSKNISYFHNMDNVTMPLTLLPLEKIVLKEGEVDFIVFDFEDFFNLTGHRLKWPRQ